MKILRFFVVVACLGSSFRTAQASDHVYYVAGNFVNVKPKVIVDALARLEGDLATSFPNAQFHSVWNGKWKKICKEIAALDMSENDKLILIGHSFGAQASVDISVCLEKLGLEVPLLITLDTIQKPFHRRANKIPDNVARNVNYFQKQQPFMHGYDDNHRADGSERGIENHLLRLEDGRDGAYHDRVVSDLVQDGVIQSIVSSELSRP